MVDIAQAAIVFVVSTFLTYSAFPALAAGCWFSRVFAYPGVGWVKAAQHPQGLALTRTNQITL